jgi:hypothetical protein
MRPVTLLLAVILSAPSCFAAKTLYVSPGGPLPSIEKARDAIRAIKAAGELAEPVTVVVRGGSYALAGTLTFTAEDSGTPRCPITYRTAPGETVTLTGGRPVQGWRKYKGNIYVADLAAQGFEDFRFRELFFRGERQILARYPHFDPQHPVTGGLLYVEDTAAQSKNSFYYKEGSIPFDKWTGISQAEVNIFPYNCWDHNIIRITNVDPEMSLVTLRDNVAGNIQVGNRYFIQNVFDALDAPGEWFSDYATGKLYFQPPTGAAPADGDVVVPAIENLVELSGTPDSPVHDLRFQGFTLKCARQDGITLEGARACEVIGNTVTQVGGVGVNAGYLRNAVKGIGLPWRKSGVARINIHSGDRALLFSHPCAECRIAGNDISSIGGDGIALGGNKNIADNNHLYRTGLYDMVCAGVTACGDENTISHNNIHDVPRDGIFINGKLNIAEYNDIRNSMLYTADNAAIALRQHDVSQAVRNIGNVLRYNRLLDTVGYGSYPHCTHPEDGFGSPFCSFGVYLDGSICGVTVYGNIIARTGGDSVFIQFGGGNTVENNIFVEGDEKRIQFDSMIFFGTFMYSDAEGKYKAQEPPNQFKHNIFYYGGLATDLYREGHWDNKDWDPKQATFDDNLIWHKTRPVTVSLDNKIECKSLADWQARGYDTRSLVADPLFVDASKDDYRLKPESPAYKVGFQDINAQIARIGVYRSDERATWPLRNAVLQRETPVVFETVKSRPPIVDGFELCPVGFPPAKAQVATSGAATVLVSDEQAKTGRHSLKFTGAADVKNPWEPHLFYNPDHRSGKVHFAVDLMNSQQEPSDFYMEFRDWAKDLLVGPTFRVTRDGKFLVNGRMGSGGAEIGQVPNGEWYNVSIDFDLGDPGGQPSGQYVLKLSVAGKPDLTATLPMPDKAFRNVTWFGISSTSVARTVFYVDNLIIGPADAERVRNPGGVLAIKGSTRPLLKPQATMNNPDMLAGYWKLDEDGSAIVDSSGNGLNGDVGSALRAKGPFGRALYLDGGGGAATVPDCPLLQFGTGDFAIECWLYPLSLDIASDFKRRRVIEKAGWPESYWNIDLLSNGKVQMEMADASRKGGTTISTGAIPEKQWTHLVVVVDRKNFQTRYYLNGKLDGSFDLPRDFTGNLDVSGKPLSTGTWQSYTGMLSGLKVYRRAPNNDEIANDYERARNKYVAGAFTVIADD